MALTEAQAREILEGVQDPEIGRSIVELGMLKGVHLGDNMAHVTLALTTIACPLKGRIKADVEAALKRADPALVVTVEMTEMTAEEKSRLMARVLPDKERSPAEMMNHVARVIAVMSGKGGVGKSSVAALLAAALSRAGLKVAVLDADITGPSIPKMFGVRQGPGMSPFGIVPPQTAGGISIMSINLLLQDESQAVVWRGPLISGAIRQFWEEVVWGTVDVMLVDLPPGTSDASLTVMQSLPVNGIVMVTSPQDLAGMVVKKAAQMAKNLEVPLVGLIENMSYLPCPDCGKQIEVFGPSHGEKIAQDLEIPFLGRLPLDPALAQLGDSGGVESYESPVFAEIARKVVEEMELPCELE